MSLALELGSKARQCLKEGDNAINALKYLLEPDIVANLLSSAPDPRYAFMLRNILSPDIAYRFERSSFESLSAVHKAQWKLIEIKYLGLGHKRTLSPTHEDKVRSTRVILAKTLMQ